MINDLKKGDYKYLEKRKKRQLIFSICSMTIVFIIFITGVILYDTRKSIFAVLAALASLPAAKTLVSYLVIAPYKSISKEVKNKLEDVCGDMNNCKIIYDALLSSTEKSMYAGVLYIKNGKVLGFQNTNKKITFKEIEKYIKTILNDNCNYGVIKLYDNEDKFIEAVKSEAFIESNMTEDEINKINNMNERIDKQIKIFIF